MATSDLQFVEIVDENLECTICFKRFKNPKSLTCLHTFCLACLEDWVKEKGKLTCPTCSKSYPIPEGGLQKLPPNTILNNLLETIEHFSKTDQIKCVCGKGYAKYYCEDCKQHLCSICGDHHKDFRLFAKHKLISLEDMSSMSHLQKASLHPPMCLLHEKPLEFYCKDCKISICMQCKTSNHNAWEGKHKTINVSEALKQFQETLAPLEKAAYNIKDKLKDGLETVIENSTKLEQSKDKCLRDIDNQVEEMVKTIKGNGDKMKNEVKTIYQKKNKVNNAQKDELKTMIFDIDTKLNFLNQLMKSKEPLVIESSQKEITALKEKISEFPKTSPTDKRLIKFYINKQQISTLQQSDIGYVAQSGAADCLTLKGQKSVTKGQIIFVKIIKTDECEIHADQLKATWTQPTGDAYIAQVQEDDNGGYFMTGKCKSPGVCKIDVSAYGEPIKQSPLIIQVEKKGLVNTIKLDQKNVRDVRDVVKCEDDCLLVSCWTNEILKYKQSGEYIGKVTLPQGIRVDRMYKMFNGNIVFIDGIKCIKVCNMNGQLIKSIGQGIFKNPSGIHVDEASNVVYVGDWNIGCVFLFDINSGHMVKKIGSKGNRVGEMNAVTDVTFTNQGNVILVECFNSRIQLFDKEGRFMKVLVKSGEKNGKVRNPCRLVVDEDDNIIISSDHKLQLFHKDGTFIKRIDKPEDQIKYVYGITVISYYPHRVAITNDCDKTVQVFNY
ncbi:tripartite motif-containing protein 2-like [Anneissia japonica]|uniref:tripartite motif-containing protein 2-like n=1 Tax=Anneissia japonica TaxID=1529436 RepID=UPI001425BA63|nr:tripartite motif-containing protein 2-like [Anneissia japonica]